MRLHQLPTVIEYDQEHEKEILKTSDLYEASYFIAQGCQFLDIKVIHTGPKTFFVQVWLYSDHLKRLHDELIQGIAHISYSCFMDIFSDLGLFFKNLKRQARESRRAKERGYIFTRSICKAGGDDYAY